MKTIQQRAVAYTANQKARFAWEYKMMLDAYFASASSVLDELKTVMSVSEDKYLRENINKMIKYLEVLVKESDEYIVLAENFGNNPRQVCNLMTIPKGCIKEIMNLETLSL